MGRKRRNPDYDPIKIQKEMIEICQALCTGNGNVTGNEASTNMSFRAAAEELGISVSKVVKLLITGGYYTSDICENINELYDSGKTVVEIQEILGVCRATV